jgi:hypothetical protein
MARLTALEEPTTVVEVYSHSAKILNRDRSLTKKALLCTLINVVYKRAAYTSERRTPPTKRTHTSAQLNHIVSCYIVIDTVEVVSEVSFLHVRELCPVSLHLLQRARACRLRPDCSPS